MKKSISALFLLSLFAATPALALSSRPDDSDQSKPRVESRGWYENLKDRVEVRRASTTEGRASSTVKRMMVQASVAKRMIEHAGKMMQATIDRLEKLATRIESRIAKVKAEGGVTVESESALTDAKVHISAAKTELATFFSISLTSDKMAENVAAFRAAAAKVKEELRAAHASLVKAIVALKPGRSENEKKRATSTPTSIPPATTNQ